MRKSTLLLLVCLLSLNTFAQTPETTTTTTPQTIDEQFTEMVKSSNRYEDYKVIKQFKLNTLQGNIKKRISGLQAEIDGLNKTIEEQKSEVGNLTTRLGSTEETLTQTNLEKDSMNFLGNLMSKGSYNTMMWSIAGVLLLGLLFFIFKFKNSNAVTKEAQFKLDEVENEFEEYRKKALEKEQKLGRQLQDERNKLLKAAKG